MNLCRRGRLCFILLLATVVSGQDEEKTPTLRVMAKSSVYNVNDKKALYCNGTYLKEKIEWYSPTNEVVKGRSVKNNRIFVERFKDESLENSLIPLIIQSAQIKDSGKWTCKSGELNETIDIIVGERVVFSSPNDTIESEEGKSIRIHCEAKGYPEPRVDWYKNAIPITEDRKYQFRSVGSDYQLEIRNLNHQDSGEYLCQALQQQLSYYTGKVTRLIVQHKPLLLDYATQQVTTEKFRSEEVYAILEETKNITCAALAYPPPTYTWTRRKKAYDEPIPPEPDMIFSAEDGSYSVLMLRIYNTSYLGQYVCAATNNRGKVSIVYHVSIGNRPSTPDSIGVVNASIDSIVFNVSCSTCFIAPKDVPIAPDPQNLTLLGFSFLFAPVVDDYNQADWEGGTEITVDIDDPENTLFLVGPLANDTKFYARVRSRNAAGFSDWVNVPDTVSTTSRAVKLIVSTFMVISSLMLFFMF